MTGPVFFIAVRIAALVIGSHSYWGQIIEKIREESNLYIK